MSRRIYTRRPGLFDRRYPGPARLFGRVYGRQIRWAAAALMAAAAVFLLFLVYGSLARRLGSGAALESPLTVSSGTITSSLDAILNSRGLSSAEAVGISAALRKNLNLRRLTPEDEYFIVFSTAGAFKYMYIQKDLKQHFAFRKTDGSFSGSVKPVEVSAVISRFSGAIASSLWESMSAQGVAAAVILDFADVFSWSVDFLTEVRAGDKYEVVYESMVTPSEKVVSRRVLAGLYDGGETGREAAFYFKGGYYDKKGDSMRSFFLRAPLQYRRISSYFSRSRRHPIFKIVRPHLGIDYAAPSGTPVSAVADGTVRFAGWKGGFGRYVEIRHANGYTTTYGHLSRYARRIRAGKRVKQGGIIAYVGSTGLSTGPHLDFRIRKNNRFVNFLKIKRRSSSGVAARHKKDFLAAARKLLPSAF
ncbi:MAG: M23 family metallopeptidase [Elusimicrobia bacterium]|nr:M23 family metallopeptidase [Elusimicrobiota bacterium]